MALALTVAPRQHGIQHPQWPHSSTPAPMFSLPFPTHTPPPHAMLQPHAQMQMPTPSPAPSISSMTSNSTLSSIPPQNTRELTREMLMTVLEYFSTLLPSRFEDRTVRLVVHGGACMLLHPDLDKLAAQTPPFLLSPPGYHNPVPQASQPQPHSTLSPFSLFALSQNPTVPPGSSTSPLINNGNDNATTRPPTPPPDVKRTTTRDVDIIARSFDSEWRQIGITNATELLKECIALTAKKFGLGLDWMNSDPDVALPMAYDPVSNTTYDPIHTDALKPNNISRHTVYTSSNGLLQLISVTPAWAVALKLVRFTKSDPGDICLILRNGTNLSGIKWTEELVENWVVNQCSPMCYRDYDPIKWSQLRGKIKFVVAMVHEYVGAPKKKDADRTPTPTPAWPPPHTIYPYQVPLSYSAAIPGFAYNIPAHATQFHSSPGVAPSLPTLPPPPPPKDSPQSRTSTFLPRSIAEWGNTSKPIPSPPPALIPTPIAALQVREGRTQANRRATDPVIPLLEVDRGRSKERRTQSWPLVGSLIAPDEDKDDTREMREGRDKESRTRQRVVDWLNSNNRHQKEKHNNLDVGGEGDGDELPVIPVLAHSSSPPQLRASPPRDMQDKRGPPVIPEIMLVDSSSTVTYSAPSDESDTLTITEKEGESPWHPYHQPAHQRVPGPEVVIPEHPAHAQHQQQLEAYSWICKPQPTSSSVHPPPLPPKPQPQPIIPSSHHLNEGGEAFVPPFLPNNTDDDEDDWESNTLLHSFSSGPSSSPLVTPGGPPPGFIPFSPGSPSTMPVIIPPTTMPTIPGVVVPVYSPASHPGYLGSPGYAASGFAGYYSGLAPHQQQHMHTPYNQSQIQELHGQGQGQDKESSNRRGISSWI